MEQFWITDIVYCVIDILMYAHDNLLFSGHLLHPKRVELVLTIRPAGMEQLCFTGKNTYVLIRFFTYCHAE